MATLYFNAREIAAKIVYFGPEGAGSNTNVRQLYGLVPAKEKSRIHHFGPLDAVEQSWYFDYVPPGGGTVPGFSTRIRVYSLPGGLQNATHRTEVVRNADGLVFIADARDSRAEANVLAMHEITVLLRDQHINLQAMPIVVQVNHTDAPDAVDAKKVFETLDSPEFPTVSAVATASRGVIETHDIMSAELSRRIRENLGGNTAAIPILPAARETVERDEELVARHITAIESALRAQRPSLEMAVQDLHVALGRRYASLTPGPRHEVPFQPREFVGTRPVHLLESRLEGDQIIVELVMERLQGGDPRRLSVALANRPHDATPVPRNTAPGVQPRPVTSDLPDKIELKSEPVDFPPVWYGVAGLAGGLLVGALVGFLAFG